MSVCVQLLGFVRLFDTLWTVAHQVPLFMEFSRQGCWSGLPFPLPGDLPDPGTEPPLCVSCIDRQIFTTGKPQIVIN